MFRRSKEIEIGGRRLTIREPAVRDVIEFLREYETGPEGSAELTAAAEKYLPRVLAGMNPAELLDLYPSQLAALWEGYKDLLRPFAAALRETGLGWLEQAARAWMSAFLSGPFIGWSETATGERPTTDGPAS